jgi:hypothetical protein
MNTIYYIGLDIHKTTIGYCIKKIDGVPRISNQIVQQAVAQLPAEQKVQQPRWKNSRS